MYVFTYGKLSGSMHSADRMKLSPKRLYAALQRAIDGDHDTTPQEEERLERLSRPKPRKIPAYAYSELDRFDLI